MGSAESDLWVEIDAGPEPEGTRLSRDPELTSSAKSHRAWDSLEDAADRAKAAITKMAETAAAAVRDTAQLAAAPDELRLEFGLRFVAGGILVVGAGGEASVRVELRYRAAASGEDRSGDGSG